MSRALVNGARGMPAVKVMAPLMVSVPVLLLLSTRAPAEDTEVMFNAALALSMMLLKLGLMVGKAAALMTNGWLAASVMGPTLMAPMPGPVKVRMLLGLAAVMPPLRANVLPLFWKTVNWVAALVST